MIDLFETDLEGVLVSDFDVVFFLIVSLQPDF